MTQRYLFFCLFGILACFVSRTVTHVAIVGGFRAAPYQFPYQVSLQDHYRRHICGGGIITNIFALSAAHCFRYGENDIAREAPALLVAGINNLHRTTPTPIIRIIEHVYTPRAYQTGSINGSYDIAVLLLKEPLELGSHQYRLGKLQLPTEADKDRNYTHQSVQIAGWGWTRIEELRSRRGYNGTSDGNLRFITGDVVSRAQCQLSYHGSMHVTETHICVKAYQEQDKAEKRGVCRGDSGSPLISYDHTVVGIASIGTRDCSEKSIPAVYTRVSHSLSFIYYIMANYRTFKPQ